MRRTVDDESDECVSKMHACRCCLRAASGVPVDENVSICVMDDWSATDPRMRSKPWWR